jgi:hypothetical protein
VGLADEIIGCLFLWNLDSLERAWMARMGWDGMLAACCLSARGRGGLQ